MLTIISSDEKLPPKLVSENPPRSVLRCNKTSKLRHPGLRCIIWKNSFWYRLTSPTAGQFKANETTDSLFYVE